MTYDTSTPRRDLDEIVLGTFTGRRPQAWRAWAPGGRLLLFETEQRGCRVLAGRAARRPARLQADPARVPHGTERWYRDGRLHAADEDGGNEGEGARGPARGRLRLIVTNPRPRHLTQDTHPTVRWYLPGHTVSVVRPH